MAHNPIKSVQLVGQLRSYTAENGTCGVVYEGAKSLNKVLNAGESIRAGWKELKVVVVDMRPHQMTWQGRLDARGEDEVDHFPVTVTMKYKVVDPARMVADVVEDTEALISDALREGLMGRFTDIPIFQQKLAEQKIRECVAVLELRDSYGLDRVGVPDVRVNLLAAHKERIGQLRAHHSQEHKIALPCKSTHHRFQVKVNVTYRVNTDDSANNDDPLYGTLEDVEELLWRERIERVLRDISQNYEHDQVSQADNAMQAGLKSLLPIRGHGLIISAVNIVTDLDEIALKHELAKEDLTHQKEIDTMKRDLTAADTRALIELGSVGGIIAMLSEAVRRGEITVSQMVSQLDEVDRTKLEQKINLIKTFRDDNTKFDVVENKIVEAIGNELAATVAASRPTATQLGMGNAARQLPKGSDTTETDKH